MNRPSPERPDPNRGIRFPRTRWSHLTTQEFVRHTANEPASEELAQELRTRLAERAGG